MNEILNSRVLQVQGEGTVKADPDLLVLTIAIRRKAREYAAAIVDLNAKTEMARKSIDQCGIARSAMKTTDFGIDPEHSNPVRGERVFLGFVAKHELHVEIPMDKEKINAVFRAFAGCGAEPELEIAFGVAEPEVLKQKAIEAAVKNARNRAEIIARAAGLNLGPIVRIDYGFSEVRIYRQSYELQGETLCEGIPAPDLEPQELNVTDRVNVTWQVAE